MANLRVQGYLTCKKTPPCRTVGLSKVTFRGRERRICLGSQGGPKGVGVLLWARCPCRQCLVLGSQSGGSSLCTPVRAVPLPRCTFHAVSGRRPGKAPRNVNVLKPSLEQNLVYCSTSQSRAVFSCSPRTLRQIGNNVGSDQASPERVNKGTGLSRLEGHTIQGHTLDTPMWTLNI